MLAALCLHEDAEPHRSTAHHHPIDAFNALAFGMNPVGASMQEI